MESGTTTTTTAACDGEWRRRVRSSAPRQSGQLRRRSDLTSRPLSGLFCAPPRQGAKAAPTSPTGSLPHRIYIQSRGCVWGGRRREGEKEERRRGRRDEPIAGRCPVVGSVKRRHGGVGGTDSRTEVRSRSVPCAQKKKRGGREGWKKRGEGVGGFFLSLSFFFNGCPVHSPTHAHTHTHT